MNAEYFRKFYNYNYTLHRRVWDCIDHITDEQFVEEVPYSIGSIRNHMVHLTGVDERWLARLRGLPAPDNLKYMDFPERSSTRARWEQAADDMLSYVDRLQNSQLEEIVQYDMPHRGGMKHTPRWQLLLHVVNHGTDHRAQVLPILHRFGAPTLEQDLIIFLWDWLLSGLTLADNTNHIVMRVSRKR